MGTTRYRYGDEQHLDFALERIFLIGRPGGISRKTCPVMVGLREETSGGKYSLVVEFKNKQGFDTTSWAQRLPKFQSFFGPGIEARMSPRKRGWLPAAGTCEKRSPTPPPPTPPLPVHNLALPSFSGQTMLRILISEKKVDK